MTQKPFEFNYLVTGGTGQLGCCLESVLPLNQKKQFYFLDKSIFDITDRNQIHAFIKHNHVDIIINCAAFTDVEKAESNPALAHHINVEGVQNLLDLCHKHQLFLLHLSTDYVFNGQKKSPYTESDITSPINQYGRSKNLGEQLILQSKMKATIIRSSWIFSSFGVNFLKSIRTQIRQNKSLNVVANQFGNPTYGPDLARFILSMIHQIPTLNHQIYHFVNTGSVTWYDFAKEIIKQLPSKTPVSLLAGHQENSKVKRPDYSVLDTTRIKKEFNLSPRHWKDALVECVSNIQYDV
ncbi:MAG: dTDP-4-dehydrorhamnose reductase [Flavobacteriaceae bacterium]|nr:dTDP-4-dehydrorhamnose reductase [Flavobacteriaceae bacterium]